jgi:hypothetical protein
VLKAKSFIPDVSTDLIRGLLKRLSIKIHDNNNAGAVNTKIIIFLSLIKFIIKNELIF